MIAALLSFALSGILLAPLLIGMALFGLIPPLKSVLLAWEWLAVALFASAYAADLLQLAPS